MQKDIEQLNKGITPHEPNLIFFKLEIEKRLKEKIGKDINIHILSDLLEIKDPNWQNAIEGYLNSQKKYLIIEPEFFEEASKIYRELANANDQIHSFGIVDIAKIQNNKVLENSLAEEIVTQNNLARTYIDYLLGRVIKCNTIEELRNNKISITADCMLYQGYVIRRINPKFYKYPTIGKEALEKQKQIKENELSILEEKIANEESILQIMGRVKDMTNFSENDIINFSNDIEEAKQKINYVIEKRELQKELDSMDLLWLNNISKKIDEKEEEKNQKESLIIENATTIESLRKDIEVNKNEKIPRSSR